ncbi:MAG: hypothetical protein QNJ32_19340 [Xenococcaceae cyanobacterium MO_167.B27]|nr:hypothetical protein [Xenococcaceae cyanobacterium MO_167.B27]
MYKYIYHNTLQYIDKLNQQRRLINQQKSRRGEGNLEQENPLQTPKLIVEAVGELVLGLKDTSTQNISLRQALVIEGYNQGKITQEISQVLGTVGGFDLQYWHPQGRNLPDLKLAIQNCLQSHDNDDTKSDIFLDTHPLENTVALLYIRGKVIENSTGESLLTLEQGIKISRRMMTIEM